MVTMYVHWLSSPCRAVMMACEVAGIKVEYEFLDIMKGEQHTAEFLKMNPSHCVPTMKEGDFVLWESRPIAIYLIDKYSPGHSLYPKDLQKRALIHKMLDFDLLTVFKAINAYVFPKAFQNKDPKPDEMEVVFKRLDETVFKGREYAVGDSLTLADLFLIAGCTFLEVVGYEISAGKFPNLAAWIKRMKASKFYTKANVNFEETKQKLSSR